MAVAVNVPAEMRCDEPGCHASEPAELCLTGVGGFVFRPVRREAVKHWQVEAIHGGVGPLSIRCPLHSKKLVSAAPGMASALTKEQ